MDKTGPFRWNSGRLDVGGGEDAAQQVRTFAPDGVSRIVELALGPNLELDLAAIAPHGVIATYAADMVAPSPQ